MSVSRGDIVLVDMPFAQGGGSITRNISRVHEPTQLLIDLATPAGQQSGLLATSAVCENLFTVGQKFVLRTIGSLPPPAMQQIDACLKAALGM